LRAPLHRETGSTGRLREMLLDPEMATVSILVTLRTSLFTPPLDYRDTDSPLTGLELSHLKAAETAQRSSTLVGFSSQHAMRGSILGSAFTTSLYLVGSQN